MHFMDENFWVAVSFLIFLYFAYKPVRNAIISSLDKKIEDIKKNLAESEKLKSDAKILLDEIQDEMNNFEKYKEHILQNAKSSTDRLIEQKSKEMDIFLSRKKDSALRMIENEQAKAADKLKGEFTEQVITIVRSYLIETKNNSVSDSEIVKKFITERS